MKSMSVSHLDGDKLIDGASYSRMENHTAKASLSHIHSVKDLKKAELQGEIFSISDEQMIRAIERAIKSMQGPETSLRFSVHDKMNQIMVKVMDNESGKVIREIPPEKLMDFIAKAMERAGILIDERR